MFTKSLEEIFSKESLKKAFSTISSKSAGLDEIGLKVFKEELSEYIDELQKELFSNRYLPEPLKHIKIKKSDNSHRPIGISSIKDKLIQKTLALELSNYFEPHFSDKSYAFRANKSSVEAIKRVKSYLQRGKVWVYRCDIENFFDTIDHDRLLLLLASHIKDSAVLELIKLFLKNGSFERYDYIEHFEGVHQGDPLSPLLSNIYLNQLDWFMEKNDISFVRYADDIVLFANSQKELQSESKKVINYINKLSLTVNLDKSKALQAIKNSFDFLGMRFEGWELFISKQKFDDIVLNIHTIAKSIHPFEDMIKRLNEYLRGLKNYYFMLLDEKHPQYKLLQEAILLALSDRVAKSRKRGVITTKTAFRAYISELEMIYPFSKTQKKDFISRTIAKGYESYLAQKSYKKDRKISTKRKRYAKKFASSSTLYISEYGVSLGVSYNKFVIKQRGKIIFSMPKTHCERIVIATLGVSLSANVIKLCSQMGIAIDFIDAKLSTPYATIYGTKNSYAKMSFTQLSLLNTPLQLKLAKAFIKGKIKNQINYLKYLNKYHKILDSHILKMERKLNNMLKIAKTQNELMGHEGQCAIIYWDALSLIVEDKKSFVGRVTFGAKDVINSALNYGYSLLYAEVQTSAIKAGLSLNISFLHAIDDKKPTLVFDMIEEFRAFVVDRVVFTMINQKEYLKLNKDRLLDAKSRQLIAKNVIERLRGYTRHRKKLKRVDTIIQEQAYLLARAVKGLSTYRPFIGRY